MAKPVTIMVSLYVPLVRGKEVTLRIPAPTNINGGRDLLNYVVEQELGNNPDVKFLLNTNTTSYILTTYFLGTHVFTYIPSLNLAAIKTTKGPGKANLEGPRDMLSDLYYASGVGNVSISNNGVQLRYIYILESPLGEAPNKSLAVFLDIPVSIASKFDTTPSQLSASSQVDTRIFMLYATEPIFGQNITQALFRSSTGECRRRPRLTSVVSGKACTLLGKYLTPELKSASPSSLETYGLLRYFLWFLITGRWNISILLQRNTLEFFAALRNSPYRIWLNTFNDPKYKGYAKYFKE